MTKLTFNSAAGSDGLTINNPAVGLFAPVGGIDYNGGGQAGDSLNLLGGGAPDLVQTYSVGTTTPPIGAGPGNSGDGFGALHWIVQCGHSLYRTGTDH